MNSPFFKKYEIKQLFISKNKYKNLKYIYKNKKLNTLFFGFKKIDRKILLTNSAIKYIYWENTDCSDENLIIIKKNKNKKTFL